MKKLTTPFEKVVGAFLLLTILVLGLFALGLGHKIGLFRPTFHVRSRLDKVYALRPGSPVTYRDLTVGWVRSYELQPDDRQPERPLLFHLALEERYRMVLRSHLRATIQQSPLGGIVPDRVIIEDPSPEEYFPTGLTLQDDATIPFQPPVSIQDKLALVADRVERNTLPMINEILANVAALTRALTDPRKDAEAPIARALQNAAALLERLNDPAGEVQGILASARALLRGIEEGKGLAGMALSDPDAKRRVTELIDHLKAVVARAEGMMDGVGEIVENARLASTHLPTLARKAEEGLGGANEALESLRSHWLLRGFVGGTIGPDTPVTTEPRAGGYAPPPGGGR